MKSKHEEPEIQLLRKKQRGEKEKIEWERKQR